MPVAALLPLAVAGMTEKVVNIDKQNTEGKNRDVVIDGDAMDRFANAFEASARRWELIVYPAMLAFVVLAAYGFFLIYTLSKDIHTLAQGMDPDMGKNLTHISESVIYLSENIRTMTRRVHNMSESVEYMSKKMDALEHMEPMLVNIRGMNASMAEVNRNMQIMNVTGDVMRREMREMGRPMDFMNNFMPW